MNCWHCERPANGTCRFCGRALCKQHVQSLPHIEVLYKGKGGVQKALVVADALYCGVCQPAEDPIELPDLD
jgi:aerobic-type carbon monoxide dehydrogenase small subunit (CoxS/CutS family)